MTEPTPSARIVPMTAEHWPEVERIYADGIATGHASFELAPPTWEAFDERKLPGHRWVALTDDDTLAGWVAASPTSPRQVYRGVVEESIYIDPAARGRGVGRALLDHLASAADADGIWTIEALVFPENAASLRLHEAAGYRRVGVRERVGLMSFGPLAGRWRDVVLLERRSATAGSD